MGLSVNLSNELVERARIAAKAQHRSVAKQIEYWAEIGETCLDNPDLPVHFVRDLLGIIADDSKKEYYEFKFEELENNENTLYSAFQENSEKTAFEAENRT